MIKIIFCFSIGFISGLWLAWPGIVDRKGWACSKDIIIKTIENKTPTKAFLAISPNYLFNRNTQQRPLTKFRLLADACLR